jgi:hypothetical protein
MGDIRDTAIPHHTSDGRRFCGADFRRATSLYRATAQHLETIVRRRAALRHLRGGMQNLVITTGAHCYSFPCGRIVYLPVLLHLLPCLLASLPRTTFPSDGHYAGRRRVFWDVDRCEMVGEVFALFYLLCLAVRVAS